jgi:hypothetical protein
VRRDELGAIGLSSAARAVLETVLETVLNTVLDAGDRRAGRRGS